MNVNIPKGYKVISEDEFDALQAEALAKQVVRFSTAGVIWRGIVVDDWTTDEPEILVDCE